MRDRFKNSRVGTGVGHGQETGANVLMGKILVGKFLAVDGFATSTLFSSAISTLDSDGVPGLAYIAAREITSLKHKIRDYAVETGSLVAEAPLAGAEGTKVLDSLGDIIIQIEEDPPRLHALGVLPLHIKEATSQPWHVSANNGLAYGRMPDMGSAQNVHAVYLH